MLVPYVVFEGLYILLDVLQEKKQRDDLRRLKNRMESDLIRIFKVNKNNGIRSAEVLNNVTVLYSQAGNLTLKLDILFDELYDTFNNIFTRGSFLMGDNSSRLINK